jgi:hypothetical protein
MVSTLARSRFLTVLKDYSKLFTYCVDSLVHRTKVADSCWFILHIRVLSSCILTSSVAAFHVLCSAYLLRLFLLYIICRIFLLAWISAVE